jgi:aryl-alcohol dehydrogenase-like predicted oxidoreductase
MEYRTFGKTGLKVYPLGMGCMTFGHGLAESTAQRILDAYAAAGGNWLDVADNYDCAEEVVGRWLKARGNRYATLVASKVRFPTGSGPNDVGLTRRHIFAGVENSLRRLQIDALDLYQAHCWDFVTPIDETLRAFEDLVRCGKVRYIGASNFSGWQITKALATSAANHWTTFASLQTQYSLLCRSPEWEILPACADGGIAVTAWSPLAAGWLSGKYREDQIPAQGTRLADAAVSEEEWRNVLSVGVNATVPHPRKLQQEEVRRNRVGEVESQRRWHIIDAVRDVAKGHDCTCSQVALAWMLNRPQPVLPVIGVTRLEQLEDNLKAVDLRLTTEEIAWLNQVSDPGAPYPIDFFNQYGIPWR